MSNDKADQCPCGKPGCFNPPMTPPDQPQTEQTPCAATWRPIESAPKDGTEILVWREDAGVLLARWIAPSDFLTDKELEGCEQEDAEDPDWFYADFCTGGRLDDGPPTRWMPLPSSPLTQDKSAKPEAPDAPRQLSQMGGSDTKTPSEEACDDCGLIAWQNNGDAKDLCGYCQMREHRDAAIADCAVMRTALNLALRAADPEMDWDVLALRIQEALLPQSGATLLAELAELRDWKESMLAVEREGDLHAVAKLLGDAMGMNVLGKSVRKVICKLVPKLREKVAVLQSQVDNNDINFEQLRMSLKYNHAKETEKLRERNPCLISRVDSELTTLREQNEQQAKRIAELSAAYSEAKERIIKDSATIGQQNAALTAAAAILREAIEVSEKCNERDYYVERIAAALAATGKEQP